MKTRFRCTCGKEITLEQRNDGTHITVEVAHDGDACYMKWFTASTTDVVVSRGAEKFVLTIHTALHLRCGEGHRLDGWAE